MTGEPAQTRDAVLEAARQADFPISADQLARWHRAGLIPRPRQRALGRGLCTVTRYPAGTATQVIALCRIKSQHRSLDRAAFQLWWEGFTVESAQVRAPLAKAAAELNSALHSLTTDDAEKSKNGFEGLISRRLGRERIERLLQAARDAVEHPSALPLPIEVPQSPMPPTMDEVLEMLLPVLASSISGLDAVALVESQSFENLALVRDEIKTMLESISLWAEPLAWLWGRRGALLRLLADIPRCISPGDLPNLLLAAMIMRRVMPAEVLAAISDPTPPQLLREIAALKVVHDQVPGADTVVTPPAIRALLRNREAAQHHLPKINKFMSEHGDEVRVILEAALSSATGPGNREQLGSP
jgi:hypothetical protein